MCSGCGAAAPGNLPLGVRRIDDDRAVQGLEHLWIAVVNISIETNAAVGVDTGREIQEQNAKIGSRAQASRLLRIYEVLERRYNARPHFKGG